MDAVVAGWLVGPEGRDALDRAAAEPAPDGLAAAERLRKVLPPDKAAAVLAQVALRRRAVTKFGDRAAGLFLTPQGLEQATRPDVAAWRAERFRAAGVRRVADLGCGIGADALAALDAGMDVLAVEADRTTAVLAGANLGRPVTVGDAVALLPDHAEDDTAVFCDPSRRTSAGRTWRVEDLSPPWSFVTQLLSTRTACVKLGPGVPHALIPDDAAATWVSHRGDLVELSLWAGRWPPARQAVLLPGGHTLHDAGRSAAGRAPAGAGQPPRAPEAGEVLYEPDPAVIRAGLVDVLAAGLSARRVSAGIAYLAGAHPVATPFATAFEVLDVRDAGEKALRAWVRSERIGSLEIKKRGLDVDPARLRRRLKPDGPGSATLVLTPTPAGARALIVRRLPSAES